MLNRSFSNPKISDNGEAGLRHRIDKITNRLSTCAGEDRGARRGADAAGGVALGKADALGGKLVEVRCFDDRVAVAGEVAPAQVVRQEHDDVRALLLSERYGISDAVADLQIDLAESAMAQAWPIPEDAPVTSARFPSSLNDGVFGIAMMSPPHRRLFRGKLGSGGGT